VDILFLLVPLSVALVFFAAWGFRWCLDHDQFDDLERHGSSIFTDGDDAVPPQSCGTDAPSRRKGVTRGP